MCLRGSIDAPELHWKLEERPANQLLEVAEEMVRRTNNVCFHIVRINCPSCSAPLLDYWRQNFDDGRPCSAIRFDILLHRSSAESIPALNPFVSSKLRVASYYTHVNNDDERSEAQFQAAWDMWDRRTAAFVSFQLETPVLQRFFDSLLREKEHGNRHYSLQLFDDDVPSWIERLVQVRLARMTWGYKTTGGVLSYPSLDIMAPLV